MRKRPAQSNDLKHERRNIQNRTQLTIHDDIVRKVADLLWQRGFYVRTSRSIPLGWELGGELDTPFQLAPFFALTRRKPEWVVIIDVLGLRMKKGGYGPLVEGTGGRRIDMLGQSIAVEVSHASSPTREVRKLRRVPVSLRLIVTTDPHASGEIGGIPIVAHTKLDGKVISGLHETYFCYEKGCDFWTRNSDERVRHRRLHKQREIDEILKRP
jgi:hypothetical protein